MTASRKRLLYAAMLVGGTISASYVLMRVWAGLTA
jgi:hypothetical protein